MKIAADCLLLFFSWGAIRFEKECSHWKFNICSKFRLHNVQSFQDISDVFFITQPVEPKICYIKPVTKWRLESPFVESILDMVLKNSRKKPISERRFSRNRKNHMLLMICENHMLYMICGKNPEINPISSVITVKFVFRSKSPKITNFIKLKECFVHFSWRFN